VKGNQRRVIFAFGGPAARGFVKSGIIEAARPPDCEVARGCGAHELSPTLCPLLRQKNGTAQAEQGDQVRASYTAVFVLPSETLGPLLTWWANRLRRPGISVFAGARQFGPPRHPCFSLSLPFLPFNFFSNQAPRNTTSLRRAQPHRGRVAEIMARAGFDPNDMAEACSRPCQKHAEKSGRAAVAPQADHPDPGDPLGIPSAARSTAVACGFTRPDTEPRRSFVGKCSRT